MLLGGRPALMVKVRAAAASGDAALLGTSGHALKGMISNFCRRHVASHWKSKRSGDWSFRPHAAAVKLLDEQLEALIVATEQIS